MKTLSQLLCAVLLALATPFLHAATPLGGLTVAVSEDGSQLVAGGDTRTLLVLDPETLEVKERHWIGTTITGLVFNGDGSVLAVHDTADTLYLFSTADWTKTKEIPKVVNFSAAPAADLFAGQNGSYREPEVAVYGFSDGSLKASVAIPKELRVAMLALKADGTKVAVYTQSAKDEAEPKVERADLPKDLKGIELKEFEQRNDGETADFLVIDVAGKSIESQEKTFFRERNGSMIYSGEEVLIIGYSNVNAKISAEGEFSLFQLANTFNYGIGFTRDHSTILTGGLANFSITPVDALTGVTGTVDKLPGWPEYFKGFSGTADGSGIYGATSGFRVVKLNPDGTVMATMQGH